MKLSFENVLNTGVGGGFVSATLVVENTKDKPFECHGVELTLTCVVRCQWNQNKAYFKGEAELFKHQMVLIGRASQDSDGTGTPIAPGRQTFPFALALPECIPPSLTAKWGVIEYLLKAVCYSNSILTSNTSAVLALDVNGSRWPRIEAAFAAPRVAAEEKKFFMSSALCRAMLQLNNPIGHVGSVLQGHLVVDNASNKTVDAIGLKILQLVTWHAKNHKNASVVVTSSAAKQLIPDSRVESKANRTIPFQLTIPESSHRPSVMTGTDCVVSSQHFLCATVKVAFAADFEVRVPFLVTPTPNELAAFAKPETVLIAPISVHASLLAAMVDDGFAATSTVQISAPAPVLVGRVGKRTDKPMMAKK
jgi:hypothetical protein